MRPYQEQYIENAEKIMSLSDTSGEIPADVDVFIKIHDENAAAIRRIVRENTELLRQEFFPVLDNIVSADEETIRQLEGFAAHLASGNLSLDIFLHYKIHNALISYARHWKKRDMLIRELYHTALALFYIQENMDIIEDRSYSWKMGMLFGEAASFIKVYDQIGRASCRERV